MIGFYFYLVKIYGVRVFCVRELEICFDFIFRISDRFREGKIRGRMEFGDI